jgi:hypothetical protein
VNEDRCSECQPERCAEFGHPASLAIDATTLEDRAQGKKRLVCRRCGENYRVKICTCCGEPIGPNVLEVKR